MATIHGDTSIYWKESRQTWAFMLDLGYRPDGKRDRREYTSKSKNALIQKRRDKIREVEDGTYTAGTVPTVAAWWEHWVEKIAHPRVRPRVLANYRSYGRAHIAPHIGPRKLNQLTVDDIRFLHDCMRGGGASDRTVQAVHNTLSRCLKDAVREGVIRDNPCERMDRPQALSRDRGAFSLAEARAVLSAARGEHVGRYTRWLMALWVGARQAEVLGLEWGRVDLDEGTMDLSWQLQQLPWAHGEHCGCGDDISPARCPYRCADAPAHFEVRACRGGLWWTRPKTSASVRLVPVPGPLLDGLREWREAWPPNEYGLVWADEDGRPRLARRDRAAWRELCKRAGVRALDLHAARHTMVTLLLEAGVSPEVIRQIAGHSSILSTRGYMHVSTEQARKALESVQFMGD